MRFDASAIEEEDWAARQKRSLISELSLESLLHDVNVSQAAVAQPAGLYALPLLARPRSGGLRPGGCPVPLPETAVFGLDEDDPGEGQWLTMGRGGTLRSEDVSEPDVVDTLCRGLDVDNQHSCDHNVYVGVVRVPTATGTEVQLVTAGGLKDVLNRRGSTAFAIQRLIRPAKHRSAFANRTRWRKAAPAEAWVVSNGLAVVDTRTGHPYAPPRPLCSAPLSSAFAPLLLTSAGAAGRGGFLTDAEGSTSSVVRVRTQSAVAETAGLCLLIAEHIEATHRPLIRVHELVADFTRDADGRWWLLQVKAIVTTPAVGSGVIPGSPNALRRPSTAPPRPPPASVDAPPPSERPTATHTVCCRCCGRRNPPAALAQTLTQRMIRSMRAHQRARGVVLSWHRHFTSPEEMPDRPGRPSDKVDDKYSRLRVCAVCYDLYKAETKLEKAARGLAQRLGVTPDSSEGQVCSARVIHPSFPAAWAAFAPAISSNDRACRPAWSGSRWRRPVRTRR